MDNIHTDRERLIAGINKVCDVVKPTYGAAGSNVIVEHHLRPFFIVTNDGKTMIDDIKLADPVEQIGANIMREVSDKSDRDSGDGRKTTLLLTQAILNEAHKIQGASPMDIKRSLDDCLPIIIKAIDDQKREIRTEEVGAVASIAAENATIGALLQEIYQQIGKEGIVELEPSNTFNTFYDLKEGVRLRNAGFIAPYMANEGDKAIYKKPKILITKQKIATLQDIDPLFQKLSNDGTTEIVIYCDEIDPSVISALAFTHVKGIFKTLIIKAPTLWKDWFYEDFAKITGATIVEPISGVTLKSVGLEHLGTCEKIITTKEETTVIGIKDVSAHIQALKELNTDESKLRASWLSTKAAVLKLGANSESELAYISKKARDGRNAAYLALKDGVVKGGGVCINIIASYMPDTVGGYILNNALKAPYKQNLVNMGIKEPNWGDDISDPALVVKNAITNAVSVAGTVLTAHGIITLIKEPQNANPSKMPIMQ